MEQMPFDVEVMCGSSSARVVAVGELDVAGVPALEAALVRTEETDIRDLLLDLRGVTFIDSSGIGCVLDAHHRARSRGVELQILPGLEVGVVFGLAGLSGRLPLVG